MNRNYIGLAVVTALSTSGCTEMFRGLYDPLPPYDPDARGVVEARRRNMPADMPEDMLSDVPSDMPPDMPRDIPEDLPVDLPPDTPTPEMDMDALPGPTGLQATGAPDRVTLSWLPVQGATRYDVRIGQGNWIPVGTQTTYEDRMAPSPNLGDVTVVASDGTSDAVVDLEVMVDARPGLARAYRVRALVGDQVTQESEEVEGSRVPGTSTVTWERSSGTEPSGYTPFSNAISVTTYQDTMAPRSGEPRQYRAVVSVEGIVTSKTSAPDVGYRLAVKQVSVGESRACAVLSVGDVKCWGNAGAALGNETGNAITIGATGTPPPSLKLGGKAVKVVVGDSHACALMATGDVRCWGDGNNGVLGSGDERVIGDKLGDMPPPVVALGGQVRDITTSGTLNCAVMTNEQIRCWGKGSFGALGNESTNDIGSQPGDVPPPVVPAPEPLALASSKSFAFTNHNCVIDAFRKVRCWGYNQVGQLGVGNNGNVGDAMGEMPPALETDVGGNAQMLALGLGWSCVLISGKPRCWGLSFGEPGSNRIGDAMGEMPPPVVNIGSQTANAIHAGRDHACAITQGGGVICWGSNIEGQLGYEDKVNRPAFAHGRHNDQVSLAGAVVSMALGDTNTCALMGDYKLKCWGDGVGDAQGEMPPPTLKLW